MACRPDGNDTLYFVYISSLLTFPPAQQISWAGIQGAIQTSSRAASIFKFLRKCARSQLNPANKRVIRSRLRNKEIKKGKKQN